jgi:Fe(3+) dicitrate transport protein
MKSKAFKILFFLLVSVNAFSQFRLTGSIQSEEDSTIVQECTIHLNDGKRATFADASGKFSFSDLPAGNHILHFTSSDFQYIQLNATLTNGDRTIQVYLKPRRKVLSEVMVTDANGDLGFTRLRAVEDMGIYEGKKSEVIIPDKLVANVSTNNARQVYSRVAGLNIWENDGGGLQLSIGGRGLDPNRTANFNTRQNGYDISADALGYPESYYTPPVEGIGKIQIVRGAASLQYGTQFGGLINFEMKKPVEDRKFELIARQTAGSFGFYNAFTSASGTLNKISYYSFFQYKRGDGWRKNSQFDSYTAFANVNYQISEKTKIGIDYTLQDYLAQQPGGLTDRMFAANPRQTNRERNWFKMNWNLFAFHFDHKFNPSSEFNVRVFGLAANRYSVGFRPYRPATEEDPENYEYRDLIRGDFNNWGAEARFLTRYKLASSPAVLLIGTRYYDGFGQSSQGLGSKGKDADFSFIDSEASVLSDYRFPNRNASLFAENIFFLTEKLSLTPGVRLEYINTSAQGYYNNVSRDLAGNIIEITRNDQNRKSDRNILLAGLGASYKTDSNMDIYFNASRNYRSITFNDMQIINQSARIDPDLSDEKGYSIDLGIRSEESTNFNYDLSLFYMNYDNRIGEVDSGDGINVFRLRTNVGQAIISGLETYAEADILQMLSPQRKDWSGIVFSNLAYIKSEYVKSDVTNVEGKEVEFVPSLNLKSGIRLGYRDLKTSLQYSYLAKQFSDATNAAEADPGAVIGVIPAYHVMDLSISYDLKKFRIEGSVNNLTNQMYFTRRATAYPGPGIIPSDGRSFFLTLQAKL